MENGKTKNEEKTDPNQNVARTYVTDDVIDDVTISKARYGWFNYRPDHLQFLNKARFFLVVISISVFTQGMLNAGMDNTFITSIEKRYGFTTTKNALFATVFHISGGLFSGCIGYAGHKHRPFTISLGIMALIAGTVTLTIPHFIAPDYEAGVSSDQDICSAKPNTTTVNINPDFCEPVISNNWKYFLIFLCGHALNGLGSSPIHSLSYAHIDQITDRGQNGVYFSIMASCSLFGPAIGFIGASSVLKIYVDINQPVNSSLEPSDRNWVGAWWIGYLIGAALLFLPLIFMLGFPRLFPDSKAIEEKKKQYADTIEDSGLKHDLSSVLPSTKSLVKNPPYMFLCLAMSAEYLAIGGFSNYLPKFVETQYHYTASEAALFTGLIVIPGAAGGILLGGYLSKRFKWNCKEALKASTILTFLALVSVIAVLAGCDGRTVVGSNEEAYYNSSGSISLNSTCNRLCDCSTKYYKPICTYEDQKTYFSPCHAGCPQLTDGKYYNCSCLPPDVTHATDGHCAPDCTLFPLFIIGAFLLMTFTFMNKVPMLNATFRVVPEGQGSFAMGFQQIFIRFLGFIPAPTLFGKLIDESCQLWGVDDCSGERLNCLEYDNKNFRNYMFILGVVTKFVSLFFIFFAYKTYKLPPPTSKPSSTINTQHKIRTESNTDDHNRSRCSSVNVAPKYDNNDLEAGGAYRNKAYTTSQEELNIEELEGIEMVEEKPKLEKALSENTNSIKEEASIA